MRIIYIAGLLLLAVSGMAFQCSKPVEEGTVYTGKLEIKAICMNYTLTVTAGNIDTSMVVEDWTDPTTNNSYENAFALANPCSFPDSIQAGQEFKFVITSPAPEQCAVCLAYYPVPSKKLHIRVVNQ